MSATDGSISFFIYFILKTEGKFNICIVVLIVKHIIWKFRFLYQGKLFIRYISYCNKLKRKIYINSWIGTTFVNEWYFIKYSYIFLIKNKMFYFIISLVLYWKLLFIIDSKQKYIVMAEFI